MKLCFTHSDSSSHYHTWQPRTHGQTDSFIPTIASEYSFKLVQSSISNSHSGYIIVAPHTQDYVIFKYIRKHWPLAKIVAPVTDNVEYDIYEWYKMAIAQGVKKPKNYLGMVAMGAEFSHFEELLAHFEEQAEKLSTKVVVVEWSAPPELLSRVRVLFDNSKYVTHHFLSMGYSLFNNGEVSEEYLNAAIKLTPSAF